LLINICCVLDGNKIPLY